MFGRCNETRCHRIIYNESSLTQEQIIAGCRKGDAEARRELYMRYAGAMYGVVRRYVRDRATAEDLLHDGFVTLYTHIGEYRGSGPFEGWCRRIFVNTVMSHFRRKNPLAEADELSSPQAGGSSGVSRTSRAACSSGES